MSTDEKSLPINIPELRRLLAEATPGPWEIKKAGAFTEVWHVECGLLALIQLGARGSRFADSIAELIVEAINSLPGLLDELERLRNDP